jgi:hypothetical protein
VDSTKQVWWTIKKMDIGEENNDNGKDFFHDVEVSWKQLFTRQWQNFEFLNFEQAKFRLHPSYYQNYQCCNQKFSPPTGSRLSSTAKVEAPIWLEISDCSYSETRFAHIQRQDLHIFRDKICTDQKYKQKVKWKRSTKLIFLKFL